MLLAEPAVYLFSEEASWKKIYLGLCVGFWRSCFSGIVFVMGSRTRFNAPFVNYIAEKIDLMPGVKDEGEFFCPCAL